MRRLRVLAPLALAAAAASTPAALTLEAAPDGPPFARLVFTPPTFGDCTIVAAWLRPRTAHDSARGRIPITDITVVRAIPQDPLHSDQLALVRGQGRGSPFSGVATSTTAMVDGERRWVWKGHTAYPPPPELRWTCGAAEASARVQPVAPPVAAPAD